MFMGRPLMFGVWVHGKRKPGKHSMQGRRTTELYWNMRLNVVDGVAWALSHMHRDCSPPIIHPDIKQQRFVGFWVWSSCIWLRHIQASTNWTSFAGTFGYTAPGDFSFEFPSKFIIWLKNVRSFSFSRIERDHSFFCRICLAKVITKLMFYSFGVATLAAIMGRHPGDLIYYYWHLRRHHPHLHQPSPASVICCGASSWGSSARSAWSWHLLACMLIPNTGQPCSKLQALPTRWPPLSKPFSMTMLGELLGH